MTSTLDTYTINAILKSDIFVKTFTLEKIAEMRLIHPLFKRVIDSKITLDVESRDNTSIEKIIFKRPYANKDIGDIEDRMMRLNVPRVTEDIESITIISIRCILSDHHVNPFKILNDNKSILEMFNISANDSDTSTSNISIMYINNNVLPTVIQLNEEQGYSTVVPTHINGDVITNEEIIERIGHLTITLVKMNDQLYVGYTRYDNEYYSESRGRTHIYNIDNEVISVIDDRHEFIFVLDNRDINCHIITDQHNEVIITSYTSRLRIPWKKITNIYDIVTPAMYKALFSSMSQLYC